VFTEIELQGIMHELESALSEIFSGTRVINIVKEIDGSIVVEIVTSAEALEDVEEELAAKAAELHSEYDHEFIFVVRSDNDGESTDEE